MIGLPVALAIVAEALWLAPEPEITSFAAGPRARLSTRPCAPWLADFGSCARNLIVSPGRALIVDAYVLEPTARTPSVKLVTLCVGAVVVFGVVAVEVRDVVVVL